MPADPYLRPWSERVLQDLAGFELLDAHAHLGLNDPDGFTFEAADLLASLDETGSRSVAIPMHEPGGYGVANDQMIRDAQASNGRLVAFCRTTPDEDALSEVRRCVEAGARGLKLHPRSDGFRLDDPRLDGVFAYMAQQRLPVLVHAGRGMPALGRHALDRCRQHPRLPLILAHAGISDLSQLVHVVDGYPNLFFDTSCFAPADLLHLFTAVPPGRVLFATDLPYSTSAQGVIFTFRCAQQAGFTSEQLRSLAGAQLHRLIGGEPAAELGPALGPGRLRVVPPLERAYGWIMLAIGQRGSGGDGERPVGLARLACDVPPSDPAYEVCQSVNALIDRHEDADQARGSQPVQGYSHLHLLAAAAVVAKTPDVAVPAL